MHTKMPAEYTKLVELKCVFIYIYANNTKHYHFLNSTYYINNLQVVINGFINGQHMNTDASYISHRYVYDENIFWVARLLKW